MGLAPARAPAAVVGIGVICPGAAQHADLWPLLIAGRSVAAPVRAFSADDLPVRFACEVADDLSPWLDRTERRRLDRATQLGLIAARRALDDAGGADVAPDRIAVTVGSSIGGWSSSAAASAALAADPPTAIDRLTIPRMMPNATAAILTSEVGARGPSLTISTACSSGAHAIGEGLEMLRSGRADMVIAGGVDALVIPPALAAFARLGALSTRNDDPAAASRPFDSARDGFVMGEGAAFVVLRRPEDVGDRTVHAHLVGYAANSDAHDLMAPEPTGSRAADCIRAALRDADLGVHDVGHINAHGTSTVLNDRVEAMAMHLVFGETTPPVTSTKGVIGHPQGASGAIELATTVLALEHGVVPPTPNVTDPDPDLGVDLVAETGGRALRPGASAVSTTFAFGGHNAALVVTP